MLGRSALLFLGACVFKAQHPEYSDDLCLASADDLLRASERGAPFPDQHIDHRDPEREPWDRPFVRPRGARIPA